jgi:long-chain fatty acid transport protein
VTILSARLGLVGLILMLINLFLFNIPHTAFGEGFRILDHGASATGQAAAFAAQADDPSALHYNPAGMSQLEGIQIYVGTLLIGGKSRFKSASGGTVEGGVDGAIANPPPSTFFLTAHLPALGLERLTNWTAGIGLTIPYALQLDYPEDSLFAPIVTQAALPLLDIKPTLAYRVNDYIAIGGGLDIYTFAGFLGEGQGEFQRKVGPTTLEANGTDTALGFNASLLLTPIRNEAGKPLVNFAFVYRNGADLKLKGDFRANGALVADAAATVELPDVYTWALAGWPIRNTRHEWKVEVDVEYADWTDFKDLNLRLSNFRDPNLQPVFGQTIPQPRNYQDSWLFLLGTEYKLLSPPALPDWDVAFRAGYIRSETPIPSRTFEPAVPDADYNAFSAGVGFLCRAPGKLLGIFSCDSLGAKAIGIDLAYQILLYQTRGINNNLQPVLNGEWDTTLHVGALSLRVNF